MLFHKLLGHFWTSGSLLLFFQFTGYFVIYEDWNWRVRGKFQIHFHIVEEVSYFKKFEQLWYVKIHQFLHLSIIILFLLICNEFSWKCNMFEWNGSNFQYPSRSKFNGQPILQIENLIWLIDRCERCRNCLDLTSDEFLRGRLHWVLIKRYYASHRTWLYLSTNHCLIPNLIRNFNCGFPNYMFR